MSRLAWPIFVAAAALEVGGDAAWRSGLRGGGLSRMALGFVALGIYGLVVNLVPWDFSRLLGVYVGVFAVLSVLYGHFILNEGVPLSTWMGLGMIIGGGLVIQVGAWMRF